MKKVMVLGILILFLLSACAPQGSKSQESNTAEVSDSITIVENTDLTGTWSGPYAENMHVNSLIYYGETARNTCDFASKGVYTFELTQDQDKFSGTINVVGAGAQVRGDADCGSGGNYTQQGTVRGNISGSVISGTLILDPIKYSLSGRVSDGKITATYTGVGQNDDIAKATYSGSFTLEKQS